MAQKGVNLRLAAAEGLEALYGGAAAPHFENCFTIFTACVGIKRTGFLKCAPGVGAQHFGPLVAVIAGAVSPGKDVRERVLEAVEGRRDNHSDLAANLVQYFLDVGFGARL